MKENSDFRNQKFFIRLRSSGILREIFANNETEAIKQYILQGFQITLTDENIVKKYSLNGKFSIYDVYFNYYGKLQWDLIVTNKKKGIFSFLAKIL